MNAPPPHVAATGLSSENTAVSALPRPNTHLPEEANQSEPFFSKINGLTSVLGRKYTARDLGQYIAVEKRTQDYALQLTVPHKFSTFLQHHTTVTTVLQLMSEQKPWTKTLCYQKEWSCRWTFGSARHTLAKLLHGPPWPPTQRPC